MLDRDVIIKRAIDECMEEMYQKAQPPANYKELVEKVKNKELFESPEDPIYNRHYLSQEEFEYIKNKYSDAYRFKPHWKKDIEVLEEYLEKGGNKDKYIPETMEEDGSTHPGYRSYEKVKPIRSQIQDLIQDEDLANKVADLVFNTIKECKDYYKFDQTQEIFDFHICLGASPTSNKDAVKQYWESQGKSIEIEDRNPLLFWDKEYYGSAFEEVMLDEYGKEWKEFWNKQYQNKLEEDKKHKEEELKKWENYKPSPKFKVGDLVRSKDDSIAREVFAIQEGGYRIVGGFIPFEEENKWYHCYEQFKNYC